MPTQSGITTSLKYVAESTVGVTPTSPTMKLMRPTSRNINLAKNLLESQEVLSHAQEVSVRHGFNSIEGQVGGELLTDDWDDWIVAALGASAFTANAANATAQVVGITAPATVTGFGTDDDLQVGDVVKLANFSNAGNNGLFIVATATTTSFTVALPSGGTLTTEADGTLDLSYASASLGIAAKKTFSIERSFPDITQHQLFKGVTPNQLAVSIQPEQIPTLAFTVLGLRALAMSGTSAATSVTDPSDNEPYAFFDGAIVYNGAVVGNVTGLDFNINLNRALQPVVGSKFSPDIYEGRRQVSGTMNAMLESATVYNHFVNETEVPITCILYDPDGINWHAFQMPRVKLTGAPIDPGQTGPVIVQSPFRALRSSTYSTALKWMKYEAP